MDIFIKPNIELIKDYCKERNNKVDPERFFSYYESQGWKVGRNPMKSWKSAIHTWEKPNNYSNGTQRVERDEPEWLTGYLKDLEKMEG